MLRSIHAIPLLLSLAFGHAHAALAGGEGGGCLDCHKDNVVLRTPKHRGTKPRTPKKPGKPVRKKTVNLAKMPFRPRKKRVVTLAPSPAPTN